MLHSRLKTRRLISGVLAVPLAALGLTAGTGAAQASQNTQAKTSVAVSGTVTDARGERVSAGVVVMPASTPAVAGALVEVDGRLVSRTDQSGAFSFSYPDPSGRAVTVTVTAPGFGVFRLEHVAPSQSGGTLTVQLTRSAQTIDGQSAPGTASSNQHAPQPVRPFAASGNCGGYSSDSTPPSSIRVLEYAQHNSNGSPVPGTETGIFQVDFQTYVRDVLPNEWIASWLPDSLKSGAMAAKTYGWYWVNHWRGGTFNNACYNVDDSINYQRYIPGQSDPRTDSAVSATWGTIMTMGGSIFQASYQATLTGSTSEACGSGVSGTPDTLSQWGSQNCASAGDSWQSILGIYYPGVSLHTSASATSYVFWEGQDGALWQAQGPANGALGGPQRRGYATLGTAPAVGVDSSGATYVYWRGTGPKFELWEAYWDGSSWVGPFDRGEGPLGSQPTVAVTGSGTAYVFWEGQDGALWEAQGPAKGALGAAQRRGYATLGSAPTVGVDAKGATYVYWMGTGPKFELWEAYWDGSSWVGPFDRGEGALGSQPSVAVTGGGTAYVFWEGQDGALWEAQGPANGALGAAQRRGYPTLGSAPTAGVDASGATYVYWQGTGPKFDLWEAFWDGSSWVGPFDRGEGPLGSQPAVAVVSR